MSRRLRLARTWLPVLVSVAAFVWLFSREDIDLVGTLRSLHPDDLLQLVVLLCVYGAFGLVMEAVSLVRMGDVPLGLRDTWKAARIKAASYLAYTVHYSLGMGVLTWLLRRQLRMNLGDAAGTVLLIAAFDLGLTILVATVGVILLQTEAQTVRGGVIVVAFGAMIGGFALLRAPVRLGPLDHLREWAIFKATREAPLHKLAELFVLRLVFVLTFFFLAGVALRIFGVTPPLAVLLVNVSLVALVSALPIAVAGLGTSQLAFVSLFSAYGDRETLLACSLALSAGLIAMRAGLGLAFAREFARQALQAARQEEV